MNSVIWGIRVPIDQPNPDMNESEVQPANPDQSNPMDESEFQSKFGHIIDMKSSLGNALQALRTTRKGGRPKGKDRCPCGKFTAKRAAIRRHKCQ